MSPPPLRQHGSPLQPAVKDPMEYTCAMYPEVRQMGPGNCPKCGMTPEPREATAAATEDNSELLNMTRRFWISLALTAPYAAAHGLLGRPRRSA